MLQQSSSHLTMVDILSVENRIVMRYMYHILYNFLRTVLNEKV